MINLYRGAGIFATEKPVRDTTKRLENLSPNMVYPMHGSCIDKSLFSKYTTAIMKNDFAYSGILLGQKLDTTISWYTLFECFIKYIYNGINIDNVSKIRVYYIYSNILYYI